MDMQEDMLKERREWINDYRSNNNGAFPKDLTPFMDRFNVEAALSPEEEAAKKAAEEEAAGGKKKGGKAKKEKAKKAGKGKGKKEKGEKENLKVKIATTETIRKFDIQYK